MRSEAEIRKEIQELMSRRRQVLLELDSLQEDIELLHEELVAAEEWTKQNVFEQE